MSDIYGTIPVQEREAIYMDRLGREGGTAVPGSSMQLLAAMVTVTSHGLYVLSKGDEEGCVGKVSEAVTMDPRGFHYGMTISGKLVSEAEGLANKKAILAAVESTRTYFGCEHYADAGDAVQQVVQDLQQKVQEKGWEGPKGARPTIANLIRGICIEAHIATLDKSYDLASKKWNQAILIHEATQQAFSHVPVSIRGHALTFTFGRLLRTRLLGTFTSGIIMRETRLTKPLSLAITQLAEEILEDCEKKPAPQGPGAWLPMQVLPRSLAHRSLGIVKAAEAESGSSGTKKGNTVFFEKALAREALTAFKRAMDELERDDPNRPVLGYLTLKWLFRMGGMRVKDVKHQFQLVEESLRAVEEVFGPLNRETESRQYCVTQMTNLEAWLTAHPGPGSEDKVLKPVPQQYVRDATQASLREEDYETLKGEIALIEVVVSDKEDAPSCTIC